MLAALLGGCQTPREVATYYHPADGLRTDVITENLLETTEPAREMLWLNASRVFTSGSRYLYYLEVTYAARVETGYLDIAPGQSLVIVADGKELAFGGNGSQHLRKSRGGVLNENALYSVQAADVRAIAAAKKVKVRLTGRNGLVERDFGPPNHERFRKFAALFAPSD